MLEPATREVQRCDLCDTPLRFVVPDKNAVSGATVVEFIAHTPEWCRSATIDRIMTLHRALTDSARELARSERGRHHEAIVNRRLRNQLDERTIRTTLPVPDRDGERRYWSGRDGAATYLTVAKDAANAIRFVIDHQIKSGCTDETHDIHVDEISAARAGEIRIGGDEPTILSAMPYGDVASSEY